MTSKMMTIISGTENQAPMRPTQIVTELRTPSILRRYRMSSVSAGPPRQGERRNPGSPGSGVPPR